MKITEELKALAAELDEELAAVRRTRREYIGRGWVDRVAWTAFLGKAQLLLNLLGPFARMYAKQLSMDLDNQDVAVETAAGVLRSIREGLAKDRFMSIEELVAANVLGDLMEHAEELMSKRYMLAAAVILRAILEERLRKMAEVRGLPIKGKPGIENFKVVLQQANVLDKIVAKYVDTMAGVGNAAAHNLKEFNPDDVPTQYKMTLEFLAKHAN